MENKEIIKYIEKNKQLIQNAIEQSRTLIYKEFSFYEKDDLDTLIEFTKKGKMIRGGLVLFSYEFFCKNKNVNFEDVMSLAIYMEFTQSFLLIHDDIMDKSTYRRGDYSIPHKYFLEGEKLGVSNPREYGNSMGICFGDACFAIAKYFLTKSKSQNMTQLTNFLSISISHVIASQIKDLKLGATNSDPSLEEIYALYKGKTSEYTFVMPLILGILAYEDISPDQMLLLKNFGYNLGIIFQVRDDVLNIAPEKEDKDIYTDIKENKKTIIRHLIFANADEAEKAKLNTIFGNQNLSEAEINYVKEIVIKHKVMNKLEHEMSLKIRGVKDALDFLSLDEDGRTILGSLVEYCLWRER